MHEHKDTRDADEAHERGYAAHGGEAGREDVPAQDARACHGDEHGHARRLIAVLAAAVYLLVVNSPQSLGLSRPTSWWRVVAFAVAGVVGALAASVLATPFVLAHFGPPDLRRPRHRQRQNKSRQFKHR